MVFLYTNSLSTMTTTTDNITSTVGKEKISLKRHVKELTPQNKHFLRLLGFKVINNKHH